MHDALRGVPAKGLLPALMVMVVILVISQAVYIFGAKQSDLILQLAYDGERCQQSTDSDVLLVDHWQAVARGLDRLAFEFKPSIDARLQGYRPYSARHCEVLGQLAAQIQLQGAAEARAELFVLQADDVLSALHNRRQQRADFEVHTWLEDGRLYALLLPSAVD